MEVQLNKKIWIYGDSILKCCGSVLLVDKTGSASTVLKCVLVQLLTKTVDEEVAETTHCYTYSTRAKHGLWLCAGVCVCV